MTQDTEQVEATYFSAWKARDFQALKSVLAQDVTYDGPQGHLDGPDAYTRFMERLSQTMTDIVVLKRFVTGPDVLTWFDLHTSVAPPRPTANWSHIEDGKISWVRVTFDPQPMSA